MIGTNECEYIWRNINSRLPKGVNLTRSVPVYPAYSPVGMPLVESQEPGVRGWVLASTVKVRG